jgi:hypothetical protein
VDEIAPWVSADLARVVHRALERDLGQRTASMQSLVGALELFAGGSDRVLASELVGLTDQQKDALARKSSRPSASPRRTPEPAGEVIRVNVPKTPLHVVVPKPSAAPESASSGWLLAVVVAVLAAVTVAVVLLR